MKKLTAKQAKEMSLLYSNLNDLTQKAQFKNIIDAIHKDIIIASMEGNDYTWIEKYIWDNNVEEYFKSLGYTFTEFKDCIMIEW